MNKNRVVVTGLGVIAPNAHGIDEFESALRKGVSGIRHMPELEEYKFKCQVAGIPLNYEEISQRYFSKEQLIAMNSGIKFACIAAMDAWRDADLKVPKFGCDEVAWDTGAIVGTGLGGADTVGDVVVPLTNAGNARRLGSTAIERIMMSGAAAKIAGFFALGNQVTANSSACSTGTEAILVAANRLRAGRAKRMLAGATEGNSRYLWAAFDSMRVINRNHNHEPEKASRPMSASAAGFVPAAGSGMLVLETLESALERNVNIYAEVLGGAINCGGFRMGGSITAQNPIAVQRCIHDAITDSGIGTGDIDAINGHLTATTADPAEFENWEVALHASPTSFPMINSTKSMIGHTLGAAGAIESVASILQLHRGFVHGSLNCQDLHEKLLPYSESIIQKTRETPDVRVIAKSGFGFGDVNSCVIFRKW